MKRVLRITNFTQKLGGGEKYALTLSKNLNGLGYNNIIVCPEGDYCELVKEKGFEFVNIDLAKDSLAIYKLSRFVLRNKIDIIHTHGYYGDKRGLICAALTRTKAVFTSVLSFLNVDDYGKPKRNFPLWFRNRLLRHIPDKIITVSEAAKENIIENTGVSPERVRVVLDGIDINEAKQVNYKLISAVEHELNIKSPVIAVISRLQPEKGHTYLFEALPLCLEKFPNLKLLVVGSGYAEKEYRSQVERLNLSQNVIFTGAYSHDKVLALLKIVDLMVLPSLIETCGLVNLEALLMGTPVISTRVGGVPEYVEHNKTGILVEPHNSYEIAQAICLLLGSHEFRKEMGKIGKETVLAKYSSFRHAESVASLYQKTLDAVE